MLAGVMALGGLTGCASIGPPEPPSLELPKAPEDLRAARKDDRVTLTWSVPERTTERQRVRYLGETDICRSLDAAIKVDPISRRCEKTIGKVEAAANFAAANKSAVKNASKKITASFVDALPGTLQREHSTEFATYAVEALNTAGKGAGVSNQVRVPLVPTLPAFADFAAKATGAGILITWRCPPISGRNSGMKYLFRIYRRAESSASATKIADIDATACAAGPAGLVALSNPSSSVAANQTKREDESQESFLDQTFEWEKSYFYRGTVVSVLEAAGKPAVEVEGDDTHEVELFAHDIFPPAVPEGLQAVFSGPGRRAFIDLIWAPVTDADLEGYNVYRRDGHAVAVKINSDSVKTPAYRDLRVEPGRTYFYSVSAVDQRGNESPRSEEASESVP